MSEVRIKVDVHSRSAEFHRSIHPMHVGDLREARAAFDRLVVEVRAWFDTQDAKGET